MNVNKKNIFITILFTMIFGVVLVASNVFAQDYTPIERVPWVGGETTTFPEYITGIYTFAIAVVSIAALLMITIGGFYYITAAGNQAQATTAKKIVTDALLGLIIVFIIWIVLNTINPDLIRANPSMEALRNSITEDTSTQNSTTDNNAEGGLGGNQGGTDTSSGTGAGGA